MGVFTTSLRLNAFYLNANIPGSFEISVEGGRLEDPVQKTITVSTVSDSQLQTAVIAASDAFTTRESRINQIRSDLDSAISTMRTWSSDAQAAFDDWPNKTQAQKDAALRETIRRLGIFFDRFADTLEL